MAIVICLSFSLVSQQTNKLANGLTDHGKLHLQEIRVYEEVISLEGVIHDMIDIKSLFRLLVVVIQFASKPFI